MNVCWIGLSKELERLIASCNICIEHRINPKEPFYKDLFKNTDENSWYLIITDYYSRFFEIFRLEYLTDVSVIQKLKQYFATFGICSVLRTDNGPQFTSNKFMTFCKEYNITHNSNSPYFSQSNCAIESAVKIAKSILY